MENFIGKDNVQLNSNVLNNIKKKTTKGKLKWLGDF